MAPITVRPKVLKNKKSEGLFICKANFFSICMPSKQWDYLKRKTPQKPMQKPGPSNSSAWDSLDHRSAKHSFCLEADVGQTVIPRYFGTA